MFWTSLAIGAVAGLISGGINAGLNNSQIDDDIAYLEAQMDEIDAKKKDIVALRKEAGNKYQEDIDYLELQYNIQKDEDLKTANRQDAQTTRDEATASLQANQALGELGAQQRADAMALNNQRMSNDAQTGAALSSMAASGARTSSMGDAVDMNAQVNQDAYNLTKEQQRMLQSYQLNSTLLGISNANAGIQDARNAANDIRGRYEKDGSAYRLLRAQSNNRFQDYSRSMAALNRQDDEYDRYITDFKTQKENLENGRAGSNWLAFGKGFVGATEHYQKYSYDLLPNIF